MKRCTRCILPSTVEGIQFNEDGVCLACQSYDQKKDIDWNARYETLGKLLNYYKSLGNDYDCIVPISGGKDSTYQLHLVTQVFGMRALAVTYSHNWFSEIGKKNLENALEKFNVDHIMFTPNRSLVNRLARESLFQIGDPCWHCHAGVGAFPLQVAVMYRIPLLIWGESIAESSGRATHKEPGPKYDREYFLKVSGKVNEQTMAGDDIRLKELSQYRLPSLHDMEGITGIHLGDYINWDVESQVEFIKAEYGWLEGDVEGTYKRHKEVECRMGGAHYYTCFLKRGYGLATIHASEDIRAGRITRDEGLELAQRYDIPRPAAMNEYMELAGLTECEVDAIMGEHKDKINERRSIP